MTQPWLRHLNALSLLALLCLGPASFFAQNMSESGKRANSYTATGNTDQPLAPVAPTVQRPDSAQTLADLLTVLPAADAVVTIDVARIVNEAIPRLLTSEQGLLAPVNTALAELKEQTGIEPRTVQRLALGARYAKPAPGTSQPVPDMVLVAQISEAGQLAALVRKVGQGKYREQQYGGKTLYIAPADESERKTAEATPPPNASRDEFAVVALDANTIVFGNVTEVRASLDVSAGERARISAELVAAATRNPKALLGAAGLPVPALMSDMVPGQKSGEGEFKQALSSVQQFSAAIELTPAGLELLINVRAADPEQAKTLNDALTAYKTLTSLGPVKTTRDKLVRDIFKGVTISALGSEVQVRAELTQAQFALLVKQVAADIYFSRGAEHSSSNDFAAAIAEYDKAIALDPESATTYINRANARWRKDEYAAAMADYARAIELAPDSALAYNNRGFAELQLQDYASAIVDLEKAITLDPRSAYAYNNRGLALAETGHLNQAMMDYDKSIALDDKNALAYANRGYAHYQLDELERAITDLDKAISLDPDLLDAYLYRGLTRTDMEELAAAIADFDKVIAADKQAAAAYNGRGLARYYKEDWAAAIADFDKAIANEPKMAAAYGNRALARLALGKDAEAAQDFKTCFKLDATLQSAFEDLAKEVKQARRTKARRYN